MDNGERPQVTALAASDPLCWVTPEDFEREFEAERYRNEWTWVAEHEGQVVARVVWWGRGGELLTLDCLWVDPAVSDPAVVGRLVVAAGLAALHKQGMARPPQYQLRLPGSWRDDSSLATGVDWRRRVAADTGLSEELERLQWEWQAGTALIPPTGRLALLPESNDARFVELFRRVAAGSLDATTRRAVDAVGDEAFAREELDFYRSAPGDRAWWRVARDAQGVLVGFVIPSATEQGPNIGYLGVVPEARGHGYADELLAEATCFHARTGALRISATTDLLNAPMAAAFARQGYRVTERRIVFSAPAA
jgi:RimJ/RimL family protein N-acetyltransferase